MLSYWSNLWVKFGVLVRFEEKIYEVASFGYVRTLWLED